MLQLGVVPSERDLSERYMYWPVHTGWIKGDEPFGEAGDELTKFQKWSIGLGIAGIILSAVTTTVVLTRRR